MPEINQQIKVIIEFQTKTAGMKTAIKKIQEMREAGQITGAETQRLNGELSALDEESYNAAQGMLKYEKKQKKANEAQRNATRTSGRMTGAYLSLMFTGMALTRVFGGMVKSVLDTLGVTEMFQATLLVVLLPAMEMILPFLFWLMDWFMNLPEPVQKVIGIIVILIAIIGGILTVIGMVGTFMAGGFGLIGPILQTIGSVFMWFVNLIWGAIMWVWTGVLAPFIGWVATALGVGFGTAAAIILAVIAAITAIIFGAIEAWKNNFLGFKDAVIGIWESVKQIFTGLGQFFSGVWSVIVGIFTGNFDKIKQGFSKMGEGIKNIFIGIANYVINTMNQLVSLLISSLAQIVRAIQWVWNLIPGHKKATWYQDIMAMGANKQLIPSFAEGGVMPHTGLAMVHKGETITPAGQNINTAPTINIQASISNDYDVRRLADQLSKYWVNDMERVSKGRGLI